MYIIDTNSLINNPSIIEDYDVLITSVVLRELEKLELKKMDRLLQYEIRVAKRVISAGLKEGRIRIVDVDHIEALTGYSEKYADNIIVKSAILYGCGIITDDELLKYKASSKGIEVISSDRKEEEDYTGIHEFYYDENNPEHREMMDSIQMSVTSELEMYLNPLGMKENEYLIVWDLNQPTYKDKDDEVIATGYKELGTYKFNGVRMKWIRYKDLRSYYAGKITPRNTKQRLAFDLLQNEEITVKALFGVFGAGKDYIMLSHAIELVNEGKFDKIIWVRNNIEVKNTNSIGFLPDSLEDKLRPFIAPLQDFLGGEEGLENFLADGKVEVQHLGFIRGRDIRNSIIYVTECQSNTKEHIQLLLGRVGENSQIWFNGDDKQTDSKTFELNNGVSALKRLAGNKLYGQVTMDKTERSETARLAGMLDD